MIKFNDSLWIFTETEFNQLPDGIELISINGTIAVKGKDYIDLDTRENHLAYGINNPWNHKEKHLFLMFGLSQ